MYNNYEEYMQSVLGMNMPNTYIPNNNYYEPRSPEVNLPEINDLYPEIYRLVYPMVQKACSKRNFGMFDKTMIEEMTDEVYNSIEGEETREAGEKETVLRNGDVKNPRTRETKETRRPNRNPTLRDLIKILIIRELLQSRPQRPQRPPMWDGQMPGFQRMIPPMPRDMYGNMY